MDLFNATETAYKNGYDNGYEKGYADAKGADGEICKICVCKQVCAIFNATGGVAQCRYFHREDALDGQRINLS